MALRRPRWVLGIALVAILGLGALGLGVEERLKPTSLEVPGTESSRGEQMLERYFGASAPFAILLQGPPAAIERQGPELVRELRRDPAVSTISPWDRGSVGRLRPSPRRALILADFHVGVEEAVRDTVPGLEATLATQVRPPLRATQTGFASLSRAIQDESISASKRGELIALPFLMIVLLLVFRSPVAALIPLAFGAITVFSSRGVLTLLSSWLSIDGFALTVSTMMGLALGVDYALLMVSRFREELAAGADPFEAAATTRRTAGRTTVFAGATLFLSMVVSIFILPGALLVSLAGTVIVVVMISVIVATLVAPALLALLGANIDRWPIGGARGNGEGSRLMGAVGAALRRPTLAAAVIGGAMLLLALPALGFSTGPPSVAQLPAGNDARQDAELVSSAIGPGWDAPFILVASTDDGTMTERSRLAALSRWQRKIAEDPGVQAVIGPDQISRRVAPLQDLGRRLVGDEEGGGEVERLRQLAPRLAEAQDGVALIRSGLADAASGAGLLGEGSGRAEAGAGEIADGLGRAAEGGVRAVGAIGRLVDGSGRLTEGQRRAKLGSLSLKLGLESLLPELRRNGLGEARRLRDSLRRAAAQDPSLADEAERAQQLVGQLSVSRNEVRRLRGIALRLDAGQKRLVGGGEQLHSGAERLAEAASELPSALGRLSEGADSLVAGIDRLQGGADTLERSLADGFHRSRPLETGLREASVKVSAGAGSLLRDTDRLRRESPGLFDSGYFVLSAIDGAPPADREQAGAAIDLSGGGQAAALLVVPRYTFNTPGSVALNNRLKGDAADLAAQSGLTTGVSGGAAQLADYDRVTAQRIPFVVAAITIATFLVLVIVLRALLLAALAVALNLATVAVAFGVLTLLFEVPSGWPLGGNTYVDAVGATAIFGVIFGLSIDYAVFLLMRMREAYDAGEDNAGAIKIGLEKTAGVITGAAAIMMAVFIAFAAAPIATVSQLGVGLTVAVILDATVVRIVLLPALMLLLGDRVWWLPRSLERVLPKIDLHGTGHPPARPRPSEAG